ncbi:MAG: glycerol-3-phosphate 1-O-acyltransferase PlsB [Gammaproteobacteria bacterium]|nr:glycerol-3-phosphate 1-O-acyltransferase PlsB [Gammaproteobacteria bacterium]MDH5629487.1 glycerol-3-phosphate 1-O-acyltransferase PlsB [Gammaproteobacteria bacterium]
MLLNLLYQKVVSVPLKVLVKSKLVPEKPVKALSIDTSSPIYYVLQRRSTSSFLILKEKARQLGLPEPRLISGKDEQLPIGSVFFLQNKNIFGFKGKPVKKYQRFLNQLLEQQQQDLKVNHQLIPVSIYWGRNPGKENSLIRLMFTDTESASPFRKLFLCLFQGRNSFFRFAKPVKLQEFVKGQPAHKVLLNKLTRTLRIHFHRRRQAAMGPLISNRRQTITNLIVSNNVKQAIEKEARKKNLSQAKAKKLAYQYADEIAAKYSYKTVRVIESLLTHLWNRIYDGVQVNNAEMVRELSTTHDIVYLPCHKSHIDYLLLSYSLYHESLVPPHIAAGINLNFWPIGSILRRGGAFFLRRSFGGNQLYTAVFNEYIFQLINRGIPLEFFPEGGRSRTGRLLPPKTGLLAMTVQACLRGTKKPIAFVPVYIGYERIFEGKSYLQELRGAEKKKESFGQLLGIRKTLKQAFGKVYLNFSSPVILGDYLDQHKPDWRDYKYDNETKPGWLTSQVADLSFDLMSRINATVTLNSVSLIALILLATERYAIDKKELVLQLDLLISLCKKAPFSEQTYFPEESSDTLISQAEKLGTIFTVDNPMGEIITTDEQTAILVTYYRNNILHIFIIPALIASFFIHQQSVEIKDLKTDLTAIFSLLKKELFINWNQKELTQQINSIINVYVEQGLLLKSGQTLTRAEDDSKAFQQLFTMAQIAKPTLLRYATILTLITSQSGRQNSSRQIIEKRSRELVQRISALYGLNAPEAFDKTLFKNTVNLLKDSGLLKINQNNEVIITTKLNQLYESVLTKIDARSKQVMQQTNNWANQFWDEQEE